MKSIIFSANDPGGANAIASVVALLRARGDATYGLITGPARAVFLERGIPFIDSKGIDDRTLAHRLVTINPDIFLAGSSIGITIDKRIFVELGRRVPSVYVLDFWTNYWQRFSESGKDFRYLPEKICVMDRTAQQAMISAEFPPTCLEITGNPHFEEFTKGIHCDREDPEEILFISQPISAGFSHRDLARYGYDEFQVLADVIGSLDRISSTRLRLKIRLHPMEKAGKYQRYVGGRVSISAETALAESLSRAGLVIGMFSPVLIQAAAGGKRTISYQPARLGGDSFPTKTLGITYYLSDKAQLEPFFRAYERREVLMSTIDLNTFWPPGSAQRVVSVLDNMVLGSFRA